MNEIIKAGATCEEKDQICLLIDVIEDRSDLWLIYELCPGKTMNEHLFEVKGEFLDG
jgi:hypothetical protein